MKPRVQSITIESAPRDLEPLAYCPEDAAELMAVSRTEIFALIKAGKLKSVKYAKRRIIPRFAIEEYLRDNAK